MRYREIDAGDDTFRRAGSSKGYVHPPPSGPRGRGDRGRRSGAALVAVLAVLVGAGCRSLHENGVRSRLVQLRLAQTVIPVSLETVEVALDNLPPTREGWRCSALCRASTEVAADGVRTWCLSLRSADACISARADGTGTRFWSKQGAAAAPSVVSALWALLDPSGAREARTASDEEVMALAEEEAEQFTPRWTFVGGVRTAIVSGELTPIFSFGGQAGFRYWANYYLLPGSAVEVESAQVRNRGVLTLAVQGRLELTVWSEENTRFLNLPGLTFLMAVAPIVAFDGLPVVGGKALVALHLGHLGTAVIPVFFEAGFQWLKLQDIDASGLRVSLGVGF